VTLFQQQCTVCHSNISSNVNVVSDAVTASNIEYAWIKFYLETVVGFEGANKHLKLALIQNGSVPVLSDVFVSAAGHYNILNRKIIIVM